MTTIGLNTTMGQKKSSEADFLAVKADAAIAQIEADLAALPTATNAEVKDMVGRMLNRERKVIKYLKSQL